MGAPAYSGGARRDWAADADHVDRFIRRTLNSSQTQARELAELVAELERAEAFEQRLRQIIADARDQLAAGNTAVALSMLNAALNDIDAATDVVTPTRGTSR
jgi:ABC-type Fe3+-hydroxamate transport system substrate-binding protein